MANTKTIDFNLDHTPRAALFKAQWDSEKSCLKPDTQIEHKPDWQGYNNYQRSVILSLPQFVREVKAIRTGDNNNTGINISFGEFLNHKLGISQDKNGGFNGLLRFLKIDPNSTTIQKLMTMPTLPEEYRWVVPELIRDAVETGMLANPIWQSIVASDTAISQPSVTIPQYMAADTPMYRLNEGETIPMGKIEFNEKKVYLEKAGTGIMLTREIMQYANVNILSRFLASAGKRITRTLNTMAVLRILNGDKGQGNAAPVIGVENIGAFDYDNDLLRLVIRMSLLGYKTDHIITNENEARKFLALPEIKGFSGENKLVTNVINASVPTSFQTLLSGAMPINDQMVFLDPLSALLKFTAQPLMVESEKIISNQTTETYATLTTGFAKFFDDASVIVDKSIAFSAQGFPSYMNPLAIAPETWENS